MFDEVSDLPLRERMEKATHLLRGPYGLDPVGTPPDPPRPVPVADPDVVQMAYPVSAHDAMRTAPEATRRAVLAITAGPVRKQLTAAPHTPRSTR